MGCSGTTYQAVGVRGQRYDPGVGPVKAAANLPESVSRRPKIQVPGPPLSLSWTTPRLAAAGVDCFMSTSRARLNVTAGPTPWPPASGAELAEEATPGCLRDCGAYKAAGESDAARSKPKNRFSRGLALLSAVAGSSGAVARASFERGSGPSPDQGSWRGHVAHCKCRPGNARHDLGSATADRRAAIPGSVREAAPASPLLAPNRSGPFAL
jgi:hypothetical protein